MSLYTYVSNLPISLSFFSLSASLPLCLSISSHLCLQSSYLMNDDSVSLPGIDTIDDIDSIDAIDEKNGRKILY